MILYTIYQYDKAEGCSEPIVTYDNVADALIRKNVLTKQYETEFQILRHEIGVDNPSTIYV